MQKILMILGLSALLTSCGWHLRGDTSANEAGSSAVTALSLTADDIYTPLYRTFKLEYEKRRINLNATTPKVELKLLHETMTTRILSLNNNLDPAEDEITLAVSYQITFTNQTPQPYRLLLYRTYVENKSRAAARDNEKEKLIEEMRREAAERTLNQIHTLLNPQNTSNTP